MTIDIAQVLTQMIAFLLFLWVLKTFAWKPVMRVLEERRGRIASEFERVEKLQQDVEQLKHDYQTKMAEIEQEARALRLAEINRGRETAERLQADAHQAIAQERQRLEQQMAVELAKAKVELRDYIVELTLQATSKLLHENLTEQTHRRLVDEYLRQVTEIKN